MADKERRMSDRSLENLKLGAQARYQGKVRHNFTILPETSDWLKQGGNASGRIDDLVRAAKSGELIPSYTHNGNNDDSPTSQNVYERIDSLEAENEQLRSQLAKQREAVALLQKAITPVHQGGLYKSNAAKPTKEAVEQAINLLDS